MTREEKVNLLNELLEIEEKNDIGNLTRADRREFQEWAIQALEQEPCDDMTIAYLMGYYADKEPCADSVSRQAVIDLVDKFIIPIPTMGGRDLNEETNSHLRQVKRNIEQLPSVRPQVKHYGSGERTRVYECTPKREIELCLANIECLLNIALLDSDEHIREMGGEQELLNLMNGYLDLAYRFMGIVGEPQESEVRNENNT